MIIFFFSSRRRHTRWPRDWSSDVCSSDLKKNKRPVGKNTTFRCRFGGSDFGETPAEVKGCCATAVGRGKRTRFAERPVDFESSGTVAVVGKLPPVAAGKLIAGDFEQLLGSYIEKSQTRCRQFPEIGDRSAGFDFSAEGAKITGERVGNFLGSSFGKRPAVYMAECSEHQTERSGGRLVQRKERMRSETGEEGSGFFGSESFFCKTVC